MNCYFKISKKALVLTCCLFIGSSCSKMFSNSSTAMTSLAAPQMWGNASITETTPTQNMFANMAAASCSIVMPDSLRKDEELRVTLISQGLSEINVSANNGEFFNIGSTNATLSWAGNSFQPDQYLLKFRGVKSDKTYIDCDPAVKVVTITEAAQNPVVPTPISSPEQLSFKSLHQYNLRIAKVPTEGSYDYEFFNYLGYKNQYSPTDSVAGCALGVLKNNICAFPWNEASTVALNFTENLIGYNVPKKFRFYITQGRTDVRMSGYAPQRTAFAFAMRLGQVPSRTQALTAAEYVSIQQSEKVDTSYQRLLQGEEIIVVHDGGGTVRFLSGQAQSLGGWVYIKQLDLSDSVSSIGLTPSQNLYDIQLGVVAQKNDFLSNYMNMKWGSDGDPL